LRRQRLRRALAITRIDGIAGKNGEEFGGASTEVNDNDSRSSWTITPHELERVEEEDEEQMVKQEEEEWEEKSGTRKTEDPRARELADV